MTARAWGGTSPRSTRRSAPAPTAEQIARTRTSPAPGSRSGSLRRDGAEGRSNQTEYAVATTPRNLSSPAAAWPAGARPRRASSRGGRTPMPGTPSCRVDWAAMGNVLGTLAPGLLIAAPPLGDPNFDRTVVLLALHGAEGALGFVVNRVASMSLGELLRVAGYGDAASTRTTRRSTSAARCSRAPGGSCASIPRSSRARAGSSRSATGSASRRRGRPSTRSSTTWGARARGRRPEAPHGGARLQRLGPRPARGRDRRGRVAARAARRGDPLRGGPQRGGGSRPTRCSGSPRRAGSGPWGRPDPRVCRPSPPRTGPRGRGEGGQKVE